MSAIGTLALALVAAQLLATASCQQRRPRWADRLDPLGIVPGWRFFIDPASYRDIALELRWQVVDESFGPWRDVSTVATPGRWRWLWAPHQSGALSLPASLHTLERRSAAGRDSDADSSLAYAAVLAFARRQSGNDGAVALQFAVVRSTAGVRDVRFVSQVHRC